MADIMTAITGFGGVFIGALVSWFALDKRIAADEGLAQKKFDFDKELAQRKFELDRSQLIHKRRFELAEALLADAYRFRDVMAFVRNSGGFGNEGETRESHEHEPDDIKQTRDAYFVPIERLRTQNEFISGLLAKQHTARAHFGVDAEKAFQLIGHSIQDVQLAAQMLIDTATHAEDRQFKEKMRKDIWASAASFNKGRDEVGKHIDEAVSLIEKFCRPALEWQGG